MSSTAANIVAVNPQAELAAGPASKVKNAAENLGPRQGALAPDVEGQIRKCACHPNLPGCAQWQCRQCPEGTACHF